MNKLSVVVFAVLSLLAGCGRPAVSKLPYDQMSASDFVAVVTGVGYTKGELERDVSLTEKILALAGLPSEEMVSRKDPAAFRRSVVNGFVAREVLLNEAKRRQVELSPEDMERFQDQFAAEISGKMPLTFAAVLAALGKDATAFRNNLKKDALSAKIEGIIKEQLAAALPAPDTSALAKERQDILLANRQIEKDNKALFRLATNSWKSIRAGNDFDVVGKKLPSLRKGIVYEPDFPDVGKRFADVTSDHLSPPLAYAGGIEIAKVTVKPDGTKRIARLLFKFDTLKPLPSPETQAKSLRSKAVNARFAELTKALKDKTEISTAAL